MAKLHQLLAVETSLKTQADATTKDLINTFKSKPHHFSKKIVTYKDDAVGSEAHTVSVSDIQTTVPKEIKWISEKLAKAIDAGYQIDVANTDAKADVVLEDGTIILKSIPATNLLQLEKRLREIEALIKAVPTLDPAKGFKPDADQGSGMYKADDDVRINGKKEYKTHVAFPATDKHPAQVHTYTEDVPVGKTTTKEWSSLITVAMKADLLDRTEDLIRAVKKARAKANDLDVDVATLKIGEVVLSHIFAPLPQ